MHQTKKTCKNVNSLARKNPSRSNRISYELYDQLDTFDIEGKMKNVTNSDAHSIFNGIHDKEPPTLKSICIDDDNDILCSEDF